MRRFSRLPGDRAIIIHEYLVCRTFQVIELSGAYSPQKDPYDHPYQYQ